MLGLHTADIIVLIAYVIRHHADRGVVGADGQEHGRPFHAAHVWLDDASRRDARNYPVDSGRNR